MKWMLNRYERLAYARTHSRDFMPYLTYPKLVNLIANQMEMKFRNCTPRSLPPYMKIEPTALCQLRCPGCLQSKAEYRNKLNSAMNMRLETLRSAIDPISNTLIGVSLGLYGEPMLNREIETFVEYIHSKGVAVGFPTNLSLNVSETKAARLVESGLDCIRVSLDGATKETYAQYRVGGEFDIVLRNVRLLSELKSERNRKRPRITWKYVVFDHNRHEVNKVKKEYKEYGFDSYVLVDDEHSENRRKEKKRYNRRMLKNKKPCFWLWNTVFVRWDGGVKPCCAVNMRDIGNVNESNIRSIWRSEAYKTLRRGFMKRDYPKHMHSICKQCRGVEPV